VKTLAKRLDEIEKRLRPQGPIIFIIHPRPPEGYCEEWPQYTINGHAVSLEVFEAEQAKYPNIETILIGQGMHY